MTKKNKKDKKNTVVFEQSKPIFISYGDVYLDWKLGAVDDKHPTNPVRAKIATDTLARIFRNQATVVEPKPTYKDLVRVLKTHDSEYVTQVMVDGLSNEWADAQPHLGEVALAMFAGTVRCTKAILQGKAQIAFNPQGAKHHAQYHKSSGFCVFNDMAWAANEFHKNGYKVMYIDFDAHHGDGVENLLWGQPNRITASIHDSTIFPGTGLEGHDVENGAYNWALPAESGDDELMAALEEIRDLADIVKPNVILVAAGADGHKTDPLSSLQYTGSGFVNAGLLIGDIANKHCEGKVLIGGAGGYQPFDRTPQSWVDFVTAVYNRVSNY